MVVELTAKFDAGSTLRMACSSLRVDRPSVETQRMPTEAMARQGLLTLVDQCRGLVCPFSIRYIVFIDVRDIRGLRSTCLTPNGLLHIEAREIHCNLLEAFLQGEEFREARDGSRAYRPWQRAVEGGGEHSRGRAATAIKFDGLLREKNRHYLHRGRSGRFELLA